MASKSKPIASDFAPEAQNPRGATSRFSLATIPKSLSRLGRFTPSLVRALVRALVRLAPPQHLFRAMSLP
jgi:hypothetical protein